MIAKVILPWFGGSAAVWLTCMLFFQVTLLGGYSYAHLLMRYLKPSLQTAVHVILLLLSIVWLPVMASPVWKPSGNEEPVFRIIILLTVSVGLPYFLLSTTSPLLQAWYSIVYKKALPYRLFALSNLASLIGLLAYLFIVEPNVTLPKQSISWSYAYLIFVFLCILTAIQNFMVKPLEIYEEKEIENNREIKEPPPSGKEKLLWLLLACFPSMMFLSVTNHLTQNVAAIPFLWVLPLSIYLLSFILCFDSDGWYRRNVYVWLLTAALGGISYGLITWSSHTSLKLIIPSFCAVLFIACMFCHGELAKRKPSTGYLTSFYIMFSLGGALGGIITGLIAPKVFLGYFELPVSLTGCAILLFYINFKKWMVTDIVCFILAVCVFISGGYYIYSYSSEAVFMGRNFYGSLRIIMYNKDSKNEIKSLSHGTITHGIQFTNPKRQKEAVSYYSGVSGIGIALKNMTSLPRKVGVIGLGAGTIAAYARKGDIYHFYEINPLVEKLARNKFTYLSGCMGKTEVIIGDGRLSLEREESMQYDLLVVDAFSGDSIPVHLLTLQAMELYFKHLKQDGILALHITNSHLDLQPVVQKFSRVLGKKAVLISNGDDEDNEVYPADWVLVSSNTAFFEKRGVKKASSSLMSIPELQLWTDDYNNLFRILKK